LKIFVIAGEASGDLHGANLIKEIRALRNDAQIYAIGGDMMETQGASLLFHCRDLAVVGLIEILASAKPILKAIRETKRWLREERPDLLILIDYPGFNLMMAKYAKKIGIPTFYYISPQLWAWREGRVKKIKSYIDKMAVILPFEKDFYKKHGIDVEFVGHPLLDIVKTSTNRTVFLRRLNLDSNKPTIGILPGSRHSEIARLGPIMVETALKIKSKRPEVQFLLPLAPDIKKKELNLPQGLDVKITRGCSYDTMAACDVLLAASGTVTLEAGLLGIPTVVTYKISPLTHRLARFLIKVQYASLVNLIAGKEVFPEFIQDKAKPDLLANAVLNLLRPEQAGKIRQELSLIKQQLGEPGAASRAAKLAIDLI